MSQTRNEAKLSFKVMVNRERSKVLFAEADSHFADILLSFLTLPLGRILTILPNPPPAMGGSLTNLHRSLADLDNSCFAEEGTTTKAGLLRGRSSFEAEYRMLKLDIADADYKCPKCLRCGIVSGRVEYCAACVRYCRYLMRKGGSNVLGDNGVFVTKGTSFVISDDLQIMPNEAGLFGVMRALGITDVEEAEQFLLEFGLSEFRSLLKASLTSSTPLTDVILNRTNSANILVSREIKLSPQLDEQYPTGNRNVSLKVIIERSSGKLLLSQANEDFMEFLVCLFDVPLGKTKPLLGEKSCFKAIGNLYRSAAELIDEKYFKKGMKMRLMKLDTPKRSILPATRETLLSGQRSYRVMDDLTVMPFSVMSMLAFLKEQGMAVSDVEEVELRIGLMEYLRILIASLTSTTVLTDALINHMPNKRVKRES